MNSVPQTEGALAFEATHASPAELTASAASVNAERDLLIRLVVQVTWAALPEVSAVTKGGGAPGSCRRAPNFGLSGNSLSERFPLSGWLA
jgi:hypothetical protein